MFGRPRSSYKNMVTGPPGFDTYNVYFTIQHRWFALHACWQNYVHLIGTTIQWHINHAMRSNIPLLLSKFFMVKSNLSMVKSPRLQWTIAIVDWLNPIFHGKHETFVSHLSHHVWLVIYIYIHLAVYIYVQYIYIYNIYIYVYTVYYIYNYHASRLC